MFKTRENALSLIGGLFAVMTVLAHESWLGFQARDASAFAFLAIFFYLGLIPYAIIELRRKREQEKSPGV